MKDNDTIPLVDSGGKPGGELFVQSLVLALIPAFIFNQLKKA
jgi:hypothetical protein